MVAAIRRLDAVAITQLYDVNIGGEMRKVISQTNRNGFHYILDRTNGQFIKGEPFTEVNWTAGLDPKTGKPTDYDPRKTVQDYAGKAIKYGNKAIDVRPAHYGMPTFMPNTYDASRGLTYFNAMIGRANYFNSRAADPSPGVCGDRRPRRARISCWTVSGSRLASTTKTGALRWSSSSTGAMSLR